MKEFHFAQSATFITSAVYPKSYPETALPEVAIAGSVKCGKEYTHQRLG